MSARRIQNSEYAKNTHVNCVYSSMDYTFPDLIVKRGCLLVSLGAEMKATDICSQFNFIFK
jgi:hypothetical protein